jgi:hypothetical protein
MAAAAQLALATAHLCSSLVVAAHLYFGLAVAAAA